MVRRADHTPIMSQGPKADSDRLASPRQAVWTVLACAAILTAGIAVWSNSFRGPFIFDDLGAIRDNPTLRHFPAWENFVPPHPSPVSRRPVVNLTLAINDAISGLDVRGLHAGNLLIHLLAALALFGIVRRTLLTPPLRERFGRAASGLATAVALIWAVHPLLTESVTYLTQRTELLMGLFLLLTLYGAIRGASSGHPWRWYAAAIAACALGMGSKEVMAPAPIIVLLYDRCFLSGSFREALRRRLPFYLGLAATWLILGTLLIAYPWGEATGAGFGLVEAGPWEYARTQPGVILHYLRLSFWPSSLCLDYGWPIARGFREIVPAAAAVAALLVGVWWSLRRAPALGFLGAWFFLILAPTSSVVPIVTEVAAERRMYLPLAAIVTACVVAAYGLGSRLIRRAVASPATQKLFGSTAAMAATFSVAAVLGWLTFDRNADYRDAISIWQDTVDQQQLNFRAWFNLGCSYADADRFTEAIAQYDRSIELSPAFAIAYNNRAEACVHLGRYTQATADCVKAIELRPAFAAAYVNLGNVLMLTRRRDQAISAYDKAILLMPGLAKAHLNRARALAEANRLDSALPDFDAAIALDPDSAEAYCHRANAYTKLGRCDAAIRDCDRAIEINPGCAEAYNNRATASLVAGRYDEALRDCEKAIALMPDFALAYANRGDIFFAMNRFPDALASYDAFIQRAPGLAVAYRNRATVYFRVNRMAEAIRDYTRAIALQPELGRSLLRPRDRVRQKPPI